MSLKHRVDNFWDAMKDHLASVLSLLPFLILAALLAGAVGSVVAQEETLSVTIATPAEGETFYAGPSSLLYNAPVSGWIIAPDLAAVDVQLELFRGGELVGSQFTKPHQDGTFKFFVTVNPDASIGNFPAELRTCDSCHHRTELGLLPGDLLIRVTVTNLDGLEAVAERHIIVDHADTAVVPVRVVLADNPEEAVANVPVVASTRLYMWRTRHARTLSSATGFVDMLVEALSEAPTHYVFRVEPVIVDGLYYESTEPVEVTLPPGATEAAPVTLMVHSAAGEISGSVIAQPGTSPLPLSVWAIRLPYGPFYRTETAENGRFTFPSLPVDTYLVTLDWATLQQQGVSGTEQHYDLSQNPTASVVLSLTPTDPVVLSGNIQDTAGDPLPFAWIYAEAADNFAQVDPATGEFTLPGLSNHSQTIQISAPGFYSQAHIYNPADAADFPRQIQLTPRPDVQRIPWGQGEIVVPPESSVQVDDHSIALETGWIWGEGQDEHLPTIRHGDVLISLHQARFALEARPGSLARLYVFEGEAEIINGDSPEPILVTAGQMVLFPADDSHPVPMPLDPVVSAVLQPNNKIPLTASWEPGFQAQFRDRLALIGINSAKIITSVTYFLVLLSMLAFPLYGLFLLWKKKTALSNN